MYAEVFKGENLLVNGHEIHFADWFDTSFEDCYPQSEWLSENTLVFRFEVTGKYEKMDEILIENQSGQTVQFLQLKAEDLFLLFEIPAGSSISAQATPQSPLTDYAWLSVGGQLANGMSVASLEQNFRLSGQRDDRFRYVVVIEKNSVVLREVVRLPQFERH